MFGDYWVEVRPDEYVLDVSENQDQTLCIFAISKNTESFNILGGPLLQDYYSIFNMEEGKIGFAPHTVSQKVPLADATLPKSKLSSTKDVRNAQIITWCILFVLLGGAGACFYFLLYPFLEKQFPDNAFYVVGLSTAYFVVVVLLLGYGIRPLFISIMAVSPRHGGLATPDNQKLQTVGTFAYLVVAGYVYTLIIRSFKAKLAAKEETPKVEANSE